MAPRTGSPAMVVAHRNHPASVGDLEIALQQPPVGHHTPRTAAPCLKPVRRGTRPEPDRRWTSVRNRLFWLAIIKIPSEPATAPIGGSARGYQAIFVASATLGSPAYDGQPAVYLYIAALEVNVLNCRMASVCGWVCYGLAAAAMRWWLKPVREGCVSAERAANKICSRRRGSVHSWRSGQPGPSTP